MTNTSDLLTVISNNPGATVDVSRPVLVIGVFDLFHRGHVELLRRARELGSALYVVINGDDFTESYKRRPVMSENDRLAVVLACRYVDYAIISNVHDAKPIIEKYGIKIIVHGDDWPHDAYMHQIRITEDYVKEKGIEMIYTPYYQGESTSQLIRRVAGTPARDEVTGKRRFLNVPVQFEVFSDHQETHIGIAQALRQLTDGFPRVHILSGRGKTAHIATKLLQGISASCKSVGQGVLQGCGLGDVSAKVQTLSGSVDLLIVVGGGSVIDPAKLVAGNLKIPLIVVPTALSSDCIGSPISVLSDRAGKKVSLPSTIPSMVIVDTSVTTAAPELMAIAGLCDVLSNASAILDAEDARTQARHQLDNFAIALSDSACRLLIPVNWDQFHAPIGHESLAKALILSGLAMGFSGDSVPCSGAEHAISHAIDFMGLGNGSHGLQVGITTLYCHYLRLANGKTGISSDVLHALKEIRPTLHPETIGLTKQKFMEAVKMGQEIRPDRYTILNQVTKASTLEEAYDAAFD